VTIEQGVRLLSEAVYLRWADVDTAGLHLRLPHSATKRGQTPRGWGTRSQGVPGDYGGVRVRGMSCLHELRRCRITRRTRSGTGGSRSGRRHGPRAC
jgi:hypothetical protein